MSGLRPFWRYFGGKWRLAIRYPCPRFDTIVEPFAGAAGYSLRYPDRKVILVEKYAVLAAVWRYLIRASSREVLAVPLVDCVDDLPPTTCQEARDLVGLCMSNMAVAPRRRISAGVKKARDEDGYAIGGWSERQRARVAAQVEQIRHWTVIEGDYTNAPDVLATWFVDPPYSVAGKAYIHGAAALDFPALGAWCQSRRGQVLACENAGATWLPFREFATRNSTFIAKTARDDGGRGAKRSVEVVWSSTPMLDEVL